MRQDGGVGARAPVIHNAELSTKRKKKEQKAKRNDDYCCDEPT
jgi:hypothetical protein